MNKSPFSLDHYTEEERAMLKAHHQSQDKADKFFKELFNQKISWRIVANIKTEHLYINPKGGTFEEAWKSLDYKTIMDIVFRAIHDLPRKEIDKGEMRHFLRQHQYPRLKVIK